VTRRGDSPLLDAHRAHVIVDAVSMSYRENGHELLALDNLSFTVGPREIVGLLGPSGCGKTTAINLIAGFLHPTSGRIQVRSEQDTEGRCAVVFQSDALFPWMRVSDNVAYGMDNRRRSRRDIELEVAKHLSRVQLSEATNMWPRQLSGGMKKRAELCRAWASSADVLLLDEPFGSLDSLTRETIQEVLRHLWREDPRSIVLITHDIEEALILSHRIVVLTSRPGRVKTIVSVPFPDERTNELRLTRDFVKMRQDIRALLEPVGDRRTARSTMIEPG
jgi:NitT/TauT family transport system ATP-binding protein